MSKISVTQNANWTNDCCGKKDFDFDFIRCSTRYWPDHSFSAGIHLIPYSIYEDYFYGETLATLAYSGIVYCSSFEECDQKVRQFYNDHMIECLRKAIAVLSGDIVLPPRKDEFTPPDLTNTPIP